MFDMSVGALQQFVEYYILKGFVVQRAFSVRTKSFSAHCTASLTSSILHPLLDKYKACSHLNSTSLHVHALLNMNTPFNSDWR
jgi:hypothetical protein